MNKDYFFTHDLLSQLPALAADTIMSRTLYQDEQMRAILFGFAAGQELSEHSTPMAATLHILQGEATLTLGGDEIAAQAGTWVHMPPSLPHSIYAKEPVIMLLVMIKQEK